MNRGVWVFLGAGLLASFGHAWLPGALAPAIAWDVIAVVALGAFVVGVRRNRPASRLAWWLLATGIGLLVAGDIAWDVAVYVFDHSRASVPWSDVLYLAAYPFLAAGLLRLCRSGRRSRALVVDAAVVSLAAGGLLWELCVTPTIDSATGSTFDRVVTVAYPMMDVLLVVSVVFAALSLSTWVPAATLLVSGVAMQLAADSIYARLSAENALGATRWLDPFWPASYVLVAAAALHTSMVAIGSPNPATRGETARARVALLGAALFVAPGLALLAQAQGRNDDAIGLGVVTALLAGLLVWRLANVVGESNRAYDHIEQSEKRFRALVQHASDVVVVVDSNGRVTYISPSVTDLLGADPAAVVGTTVAEHLHPDDLEGANRTLQEALEHPGRTHVFEARIRRSDGTWCWVESTCTNQLAADSVRGIVGNFRDVSERKHGEMLHAGEARVLELIAEGAPLEDALRTLVQAVETLLDGTRCSIRLVDPATGNMGWSFAPSLPREYLDALEGVTITQSSVAEVVARAPKDGNVVVIEDMSREALWPEIRAAAAAADLHLTWMMQVRAPDAAHMFAGFTVYWPRSASPGPNERSLLERWTALTAIAVDRSRARERLGFLAMHDPLTGLPNRALVLDRLGHALTRLDRNNSRLAVLFLDLDRFKLINDSLGHEVGDRVLVAVADRLSHALRGTDTVARFGGDEFLVLCEDLVSDQEAEELAERAAHALAMPMPLARGEIVVSASIGIAIARRSNEQPAALLRDADAAMYRAKARGGSRHEIFDQAMHTDAVARLLTERALRRAVDHDQLRVYLQPQRDLVTGEWAAVEALVRWLHPVRGVVEPAQFIPVAEETGLIVPIGSWVLDEACRWAGQARANGGGNLGVSVNLSARQLLRAELPDRISRTLDTFGLPPEALTLEITESVLLDDVDATGEAIRALKELGVRFAIDDFGTGYSSLTYLRRFPFDQLKIDRSFVAGLGTSRADDAIVAATIEMAHALDMVVAAEGVETATQLERLTELGCDLAQGYHVAMPQPMEMFAVHDAPEVGTGRRLA